MMRLGDVVTINPESINKDYPHNEIEYIDISSVGTGIMHGSKKLNIKEAPSRAKRIVKNNDILLATVRPNLRSFWFAKNTNKNTIASTGFAILRASSSINPRFLYYTVIHQLFTDYLTANAKGAAYPAVDTDTIQRADIYLPPFPVQRKIAAILSAYDDLIENNLRRIKLLEEMAQLIYREWFVHFRFPGHEKVKMVDSPLGKIPEGWEIAPLKEIVNTQYGYTESAKEKPVGPKYLRGTDINKTSYIDWSFVPYCPISDDQFDKYKLNVGDIVLVRMADPGKVGIVEIEIGSVFASYLIRFSIKNNLIKPYYLFSFLCDDRYQGYITGASTGTTRKSASAGVLTGIDVVIPSKLIINEFENKVFKLRKLLNNLLLKNYVLRQTRDLLLPKLISGELDVSDLDITLPEEVSA